VLGIVWGDASIEAAKKAGGITKPGAPGSAPPRCIARV